MVHAYPTSPQLWLFCGLDILFRRNNRKSAILCLKKARLLGSSMPEMLIICDSLLALLIAKDKIKYLSRAAALCPHVSTIRLALLDKNVCFDDEIFYFVMDYICKQIISTNSTITPPTEIN